MEDDIEDFENYWNDNERGIKVFDVTEAIEQKLIRFRKSQFPSRDPFEMPNIPSKGSDDKVKDPNKAIGVYSGLNFMEPEEFRFKQIAGFIDAVSGLQHNWNMLLSEGATTRFLKLAQDLKKKTKCFLLMTATPIQMRLRPFIDEINTFGVKIDGENIVGLNLIWNKLTTLPESIGNLSSLIPW